MADKTQRSRWTLDRLVELEIALARDESEDWEALERRDREIGARAARAGASAGDRRSRIAFWLESLRPPPAPDRMPAHELYVKSLTLAGRVIAALAALSGAGLAAKLLQYEGSEPVNVSAFFGLLVLLQAALAAATILLIALPLKAGRSIRLTLGFQLLRPLWIAISRVAANLAARSLDGQRREELLALAGRSHGGLAIYGRLLRWMLFRIAQIAGACFNLGALLAFMLAVAFSDLAFGWQTSLSLGTDEIGKLVRLTAAPWSWLWGEGVGYPSPSDIEGSRIVLKDGIRALNSVHLGSWWPFLALGLTTYGLLPRLALLAWAQWRIRAALDRLTFTQASVQRVLDRMSDRPIGFSSESEGRAEPAIVDNKPARPQAAFSAPSTHPEQVITLASAELLEALPKSWLGSRAIPLAASDFSSPSQSRAFADLRADEVRFVFESWMPPIEETKSLLRAARRSAGPTVPIRVQLLGKPSGAGFGPPDESSFAIWTRVLNQLGDPYCFASPLSTIAPS